MYVCKWLNKETHCIPRKKIECDFYKLCLAVSKVYWSSATLVCQHSHTEQTKVQGPRDQCILISSSSKIQSISLAQ